MFMSLFVAICLYFNVHAMEQEGSLSLKAIPIQVLNNVIAPLLVTTPLIIEARKKPLELMIQYKDTPEDRSKLSNVYLLQNFLVFAAYYAMPSPDASKIVFLRWFNMSKPTRSEKQLHIINREIKNDTLKKVVPLSTTALAINDAGTTIGVVEEHQEKSTVRYVIYLYDPKLDRKVELDYHTENKNAIIEKNGPRYKILAAFSKDNTKLMVQLPFGKIFIYTVVEPKTPPCINELFKQRQVCKELVKNHQQE